MNESEKATALQKLKEDSQRLRLKTFDLWLTIMSADPAMWRHFGHSKGAEQMVRDLAADFRKTEARLMKDFDAGKFD